VIADRPCRAPGTVGLFEAGGDFEMRNILLFAGVAMLGLAACNETPQEQQADAVRENADATADRMEERADMIEERGDAQAAAMRERAEAVEDAGQAKADAIEERD
jgi:uncharacterized membrane protein YqiK